MNTVETRRPSTINAESSDSNPPVSVIIPTYNERENVATIIKRCRDALSEYPYEIVVVDDDSPDGTWRLVQEKYSTRSVRLVRRTEDRGLATAVVQGLEEAKHDFCTVIDADLQHPPGKLRELVSALSAGADIAIGSRHAPGGRIEHWSYYRRLVSRLATLLAKFTVPSARQISDPLSGFFAVRKNLVEGIEMNPNGYKVLLELLAKCNWTHVVEVPYVFTDRARGDSKLTTREYVNFVRHVSSLVVQARGFDRWLNLISSVRSIGHKGE